LWNQYLAGLESASCGDVYSAIEMFRRATGYEFECSPKPWAASKEVEKQIDRLLDFPSCRLAIYGSLAPGEQNHSVLKGLSGIWSKGVVSGERHATGWGYTHGFPAIIWNSSGYKIEVKVFHSYDLRQHWRRLDRFEGIEYRRILVPVQDEAGVLVANIYVLNQSIADLA
jgi:gamma-glutamylcyclotransferase (GGCT)/AIG2-like uncharacterized protein YtfP